MALVKYRQKRNFKESPEPTGGKPDSQKLRFVIQKHHASRLHYDFRIEIEGVLKSWAVPKGPSTDPSVKRLAMMVEDHPYDYRSFEGIIPSGYGAGTVIVWDEGYYEPSEGEAADKKSQDKNLRKQLHAGKLKLVLHGKKLKGEFVLIKAKGRGDNGWLLMKTNDKFASEDDITEKDKSVLSKKTLEQVKKSSTNIYGSEKEKASRQGTAKIASKKLIEKQLNVATKKTASKKTKSIQKKSVVSTSTTGGKKAAFPSKLSPMLATLVDEPFNTPGWLYEVKWDGYRAIAFCNKKKVTIKSRNDKLFNDKFYPVKQELERMNLHAVVDGEIVVLDESGRSNFGALQNWRSEADGQLYFYVFDLLWINGKDITSESFEERRKLLEQLIPESDIIRMSETFDQDGIVFFELAEKMGLEGIIAKKADSTYSTGLRSGEWLKIKANKRQEMVIGGYTRNVGSSKAFSSLLVGVFDKKVLRYTGKVGTGFNDQQQKDMLKKFKPLIIKKSPFTEMPDINKPSRFRPNPPKATAVWLKPKLVCEVAFTEMTTDGVMRHPAFEGMRLDKNADVVVLEKPKKTEKVKATKKSATKLLKPAGKKELKTLLNPSEETQVKIIKGNEVKFTNLSKIYWPKEKITKRDMLNYYYQVAPYILPYLKNRPQSLNRHPNGITGKSFYQKDVTGKAPDWIKKYKYRSEDEPQDKHFMVATDESSLLYMASLGCIEMNPWSSTIETPNHPDWCIIDLDPADNTFDQVIEAAQVTRQVLETMGAKCYAKTSGSTGIHIYIPMGAKYTYEQSKEFARIIATMVTRELPNFTSIERIVKARKGKMYIDFLQNRPQATVSCAYSLRPKPGATVSMPLHWDEVKKGLKMSDFTIFNALERIKSEGDIFKTVLGKGINLEKIVNKL
ncbi:MAG: DNA ligase D [Bacteroidota bacterium]|nr:DNA ligase D [Bacteroidota bacterium]